MVAIDCSVSCCDLLDIAYQIVNQRKYGVKCSEVIYCDFSKYYLSECRNADYLALIASGTEEIFTTIFTIEFNNHICNQVDEEVNEDTYWLPTYPLCEKEEGFNTGMQYYVNLKEYYTSNNLPTGTIKPNTIGDPDYVAPVYDSEACPLTYLMCEELNLSFESVDDSKISLLSVGNLVSPGSVIGDYLIEWRLGSIYGTVALVSGSGNDSAIQATHPFVDEPIQGGNLYPVIRYLEVDGIKYTSLYEEGVRFSPDLSDCLSPVTVVSLNCSNGTLMNDLYTHRLTYINSIDPIYKAERIFRFDLDTDGNTNYFAWQFAGFTVADRVTISYISILDEENPILLDDWIVGANSNAMNMNTTPKQFGDGQQLLSEVSDLSKINYNVGDYLLIHIRPRVNEPSNPNTNWVFSFRCLSTFSCLPISPDVQRIDLSTVGMTYDEVNCKYDVNFSFFEPLPAYPTSPDIFKYLSYIGTNIGSPVLGETTATLHMYKNTTVVTYAYYLNTACISQEGPSTCSKVGNVITFSFQYSSDYLRYKNLYNAILAHPHFTNYTSDNTKIDHYKFFQIYVLIANTCGDSYTAIFMSIHFSSVFVFNDAAKTITITLNSVTLGLPTQSCYNISQLETRIIAVQDLINAANFNHTTSIAASSPFGALNSQEVVTNDTDKPFYFSYLFYSGILKVLCTLGEPWCYDNVLDAYILYKVAVNVQITNEADPMNNWRLRLMLSEDGCLINNPSNYITVYEIQNGVIILPLP